MAITSSPFFRNAFKTGVTSLANMATVATGRTAESIENLETPQISYCRFGGHRILKHLGLALDFDVDLQA